MTTPFQQAVTTQPAPAIEGDFCDANPRYTVDAGQGALVAGPNGVIVGRAGWLAPPVDNDNANAVVNNYGAGPIAGLVHREGQALITRFLDAFSMVVPRGFGVTLFSGGGFWVKNAGAGAALVGQKMYANLSDGSFSFAATASPTAGATSTASTIAAATSTSTGSIAGNVATLTAVSVGTIYPGTAISGTNVAAGTKIVAQLTPLLAGEALGGIGRYYVNIPNQTVASTTLSGTYGLLTVGGTIAGTFGVGQVLSGGGTAAGTTITAPITGLGGAGTYVVDGTQTVGSGAIVVAAVNVETKWACMSAGLAGELVKVSDHLLG